MKPSALVQCVAASVLFFTVVVKSVPVRATVNIPSNGEPFPLYPRSLLPNPDTGLQVRHGGTEGTEGESTQKETLSPVGKLKVRLMHTSQAAARMHTFHHMWGVDLGVDNRQLEIEFIIEMSSLIDAWNEAATANLSDRDRARRDHLQPIIFNILRSTLELCDQLKAKNLDTPSKEKVETMIGKIRAVKDFKADERGGQGV